MSEPSEVLTFLFSDIEGSARLWEQQPEPMRLALARHDAVARASVEAHGGHVVKTTGDGLHAAFDCPARALDAVLQLQLDIEDETAAAGLLLRVRCGLHVGANERRDGDFYGPAVNRAARISGIAHGGQTLLSQALVDHVGKRLPVDAGLQDLGLVRLRDLGAPERVHQLTHPRLRVRFPPLRSLEATPNNLPQQLDSFIGRENELTEARQLLASTRLITLIGMGGIGKSRLSVQLGADVLNDHPDGVWLVELAPLADPRGVPQAVASVLGIKEEAGQAIAESLAGHVRDKRLLFIFDNCEHLLPACAALAKQLLQAGPGVKVLATSRARLQLAGETCFTVTTLSVPDPRHPAGVDDMKRHEAVRLFVDRATAGQPAFRLVPGNAAAVADICHRLDGIPLAIELAAARIRALSVETIAERLSDRFRLLVSGDQTVLPRQRTLRALIDWSHDLLSEVERTLFRRLAVFAGGWTLDAAAAVGGDGNALAPADVPDTLVQLVEKSLVVMELGGTRYRLLDTVQHYARQRLEQAEEQSAVRTRHLAFYVAHAEAARPQLTGPDQGAWSTRLDRERDNFVAAGRWSEQAAQGDELGLRLMHALRPHWINRGQLTLGLGLAQELLARRGLQARSHARCMALFGAGQLSFFMGRHAEAQPYLSECLAIARETNDLAVVARVLQPLGTTSLALREFDAARAQIEEAVTLARSLGNKRELAAALSALTMMHRMQGQLDLARPVCAEVVELARELGDHESIGIGLLNAAMVEMGRSCSANARAMLLEVVDLADQTGSQRLYHSALDVAAGVAASMRQWHDAATFLGATRTQQGEAAFQRDAADDAFLAPLVAATRAALGPDIFAAIETRGSMLRHPRTLDFLRGWLTDGGPPTRRRQVTSSRSPGRERGVAPRRST